MRKSPNGLAWLSTAAVMGLCSVATIAHGYAHDPILKPSQGVSQWLDAIKAGDVDLSMRGRYEYVDVGEDSSLRKGRALTLNTQLTYNTAQFCHFAGLLQFNHNSTYWDTRHNAGADITPNRTDFPVIADPQGTALTRAFIQYSGIDATSIAIGRQFIVLDNERHYGLNEFRQQPNSFDAITVVNTSLPDIELFFALINRVKDSTQNADLSVSGNQSVSQQLFNASWKGFLPVFDLTGYAYLSADKSVPAFSTATYGLRGTGSTTAGGNIFTYSFEWAHQQNRDNNPTRYDSNYYAGFMATDLYNLIHIEGGYQILQGDADVAGHQFRTPFADNHKFHGMADVFDDLNATGIGIPNEGLKDISIEVGTELFGVDMVGGLHFFDADSGGLDYGYEIDFGAYYTWHNFLDLSFEIGHFEADDGAPTGIFDTTRYWLTASVNF